MRAAKNTLSPIQQQRFNQKNERFTLPRQPKQDRATMQAYLCSEPGLGLNGVFYGQDRSVFLLPFDADSVSSSTSLSVGLCHHDAHGMAVISTLAVCEESFSREH